MEEQAQSLIDATTGTRNDPKQDPVVTINFLYFLAAFKAGKIASNPFAQPPPGAGPMGMPVIRPGMPGFNPMLPPPTAGMPPNFAPQFMPPHGMRSQMN